MSNARNLALAAAVAGGLAPTGVYLPFAGSAAPAGWLLCDGSEVSRTTYAALFSAISTAYGVGNGSTTFNLPDMRGRIPAGKDDMGGTAAARLTAAGAGVDGATLGAAGGSETHALSETQMPSHTHDLAMKYTTIGGAGSSRNYWTRSAVDTLYDGTVTNGASSKGGGQAHNNTQPTLIANYIIKT